MKISKICNQTCVGRCLSRLPVPWRDETHVDELEALSRQVPELRRQREEASKTQRVRPRLPVHAMQEVRARGPSVLEQYFDESRK